MRLRLANAIILLLFLTGCSAPNYKQENTFTHADFIHTKNLKGTIVSFDSIINPFEAYLVCDTLLLVSNLDHAQKKKVKLFSLENGQVLSSFVQEGHADNELISCRLNYFSPQSHIFYVEDVIQNKYWACSLDSLYAHKKSIISSFYYSRDVMNIYPLDSAYVGFNFWYLNHDKYNNGIFSPIAEYPISQSQSKSRSKDFSYFVANVTGATIARNPNNGDIWVAYNHDNLIQIYDDRMNLKKQMNGPVHFDREFKEELIKNYNYVFFRKGAYVGSYKMLVSTPKHIYLLYDNINGGELPTQLQPVEVFKLDWNGGLICNYKLDKFAYTISIDSNEQWLYATCVDKETKEIQIVKYSLE